MDVINITQNMTKLKLFLNLTSNNSIEGFISSSDMKMINFFLFCSFSFDFNFLSNKKVSIASSDCLFYFISSKGRSAILYVRLFSTLRKHRLMLHNLFSEIVVEIIFANSMILFYKLYHHVFSPK